MAATLFGTTGTWAIASAETGLLVESLDYSYQCKDKPVLNEDGETVGLALYDQTAEVSLKGLVDGFDSKIATTLALSNAIPAHITVSAGTNVIKSIRRSLAQEDFEKLEATLGFYPLVLQA